MEVALTPVPVSPAKNVAADIAVQLCESVANKLEGKVMGTFSSKYLPKPEVLKGLHLLGGEEHCSPFLLDVWLLANSFTSKRLLQNLDFKSYHN